MQALLAQVGSIVLIILLGTVLSMWESTYALSEWLANAAVPFFVAAFVVALLIRYLRYRRQPSKKPLKYTHRVIRLNVVLALLFLSGLSLVWSSFAGLR